MCARTGDVLGLRQVYERLDEGGLAGTFLGCDEYVCEFFESSQRDGMCKVYFVADIVQCWVLLLGRDVVWCGVTDVR